MARITMEEQVEFPLLPVDSILELKVEEIETKEVQGNRGVWTKCEITFKILGVQITGDGSPVANYNNLLGEKIWGSVPFRLTDSPENRLRMWTEAILGIDLGVGFELDTDMYRGRRCRGITSQYEKRAINPITKEPYRQHQIESLLRWDDATTAQAPAQQAPAQQWSPPPAGSPDPWAPAAQAQPAAQPAAQQPLPAAPAPAADPWGDGWGGEPDF